MTKQEFASWKAETESSRFHWTIDAIRKHNTGDLLFYKGGENGQFVTISKSGEACVGKYEGAIPHIGEACFRVLHTRQFADQNEAIKAVIERAGLTFLLDFCGVPHSYRN